MFTLVGALLTAAVAITLGAPIDLLDPQTGQASGLSSTGDDTARTGSAVPTPNQSFTPAVQTDSAYEDEEYEDEEDEEGEYEDDEREEEEHDDDEREEDEQEEDEDGESEQEDHEDDSENDDEGSDGRSEVTETETATEDGAGSQPIVEGETGAP
ncbi:MAG: hypothetical protein ABEH80_05690 [Halobaculum sp.]